MRRGRFVALEAVISLGVLAAGMLAAAPASAALTGCSVAALNAEGVPGVVITAAVDVPASGTNPEFCDVSGTLITTGFGAPNGLAHFEVQLPANWNHKLFAKGMGGFAGFSGFPGVPINAFASDNGVDDAQALPKGYATVITDTGHTGQGFTPADFTGIVTDARWALKADGTPDEAKLTDYYFRATHQVTVAAKSLVQGFYQQSISKAYFDGCSNGGRQALMEASRFPEDFDGIVAGDPFMSIRAIANGAHVSSQFITPEGFIPFATLALIDQATTASCDAADGVKDGLIQNPGACSFKPETLLCKKGQTANCLTQGQVDSLNAYFDGSRDERGNVVYPGFAISDLGGSDGAAAWSNGFFAPGQPLPGSTQPVFDLTAPEPWGNQGFSPAPLGWQFQDHGIKFIVERDPNADPRDFAPDALGPIGARALDVFDARTEAGDADDPARFAPFIQQNRKLLIYHGFSDPALTAFRSIMLYQDLAEQTHGGIAELQENVRLFLAPGMHHCGGGPGPNSFDTLTALENWVERGQGPDSIVATKFNGDDPANGVARAMPLCKFPEEASFTGNLRKATAADISNAASWTCSPKDKRLLDVGRNGRNAGINEDEAPEFEFAQRH